jgi:urea transport system permease protein
MQRAARASSAIAWVVSACLAGVAGALYVPQVGIINPSEFAPEASIEAVIWVAVGGRGTLAGPILGAVAVNGFKSWFTGFIPELWLFALGALFVFTTLLLPRGILGTFLRPASAKAPPRAPAVTPATPSEPPRDAARERLEKVGA